jgi:hypothetical protein
MAEPKMGIPQDELANRAVHDRLLKRFREEEEKVNRDKLLFGDEDFGRSSKEND